MKLERESKSFILVEHVTPDFSEQARDLKIMGKYWLFGKSGLIPSFLVQRKDSWDKMILYRMKKLVLPCGESNPGRGGESAES